MKQEEISDDQYEKFLKQSKRFRGEFDSEVARREKLASKENQKKYQQLVDQYYAVIRQPEWEKEIKHLYLDSQFLFTVGCGHLLGYSHSNWLASSESRKIIDKLEKQIHDEKLTSQPYFQKLSFPQDLRTLLNVAAEDLEKVYNNKYICMALLDALNLPFKNSEKTVANEKPLSEFQKPLMVTKAYNELVLLALKLRARAISLGRKKYNPFSGTSFYMPEGSANALVLGEEAIKNLAAQDILIKLAELKSYLGYVNSSSLYDSFELPAQLALLELMYNVGNIRKINKQDILNKRWKKISQEIGTKIRPAAEYGRRNAQVKKWLEEAANILPANQSNILVRA